MDWLAGVPLWLFGIAAGICLAAHIYALWWLNTNLVKKSILEKPHDTPESFFAFNGLGPIVVYGFILFVRRKAFSDSRDYNHVRLARYSFLLLIAVFILLGYS